MDYKHVSLSVYDIPEWNRTKRGIVAEWAIKILDDFYNSDDEVWEILENHSGQSLNRDNVTAPYYAMRNAINRKRIEYKDHIKVILRKNRLFIYKTEATDEITI